MSDKHGKVRLLLIFYCKINNALTYCYLADIELSKVQLLGKLDSILKRGGAFSLNLILAFVTIVVKLTSVLMLEGTTITTWYL